MNARLAHHRGSRTRGIVLPTVLIFLLILSVAAVVLVEQISSQTRMAGNNANTGMSVQVAEAVLRTAAAQVVAGAYTEAQYRANASGLYYFNAANYSTTTKVPWQTTAGWATAKSLTTSFGSGDSSTTRQYMIEELPDVITPGGSKQKAYRITARVTGADNQTVVMLQTLYKI